MGLNYFSMKGVPQSKDAPFEIYSERIRLHEYQNGRRDVQDITSFLFTDSQGYLRIRPISDVNEFITDLIKTINGVGANDQLLNTTENGTDFSISNNGLDTHYFNLPIASAVNTGKLSASDWIRFDAAATPSLGDLTSNSNAINVIGGTGAVYGSGVLLDINVADAADDGILTSTDWNTFNSKIGAATNGLTLTGTTVELGGNLTKNTTIGAGSFSISFNNTQYNFDSALGKPMRFNGSGTTSVWHGLNTGGYDSQTYNIQNTTGVNFTNATGTTSIFVDNANSRLGIGVTSPAHSFTNSSSTIGIGTGNIVSTGLGWSVNASGYIAGFRNSATSNSQGIFVNTNTAATTDITLELRSSSAQPLIAYNDGFIAMGSGNFPGRTSFSDFVQFRGQTTFSLSGSSSDVISFASNSGNGIVANNVYNSSGNKFRIATTAGTTGIQFGSTFKILVANENSSVVTSGQAVTWLDAFTSSRNAGGFISNIVNGRLGFNNVVPASIFNTASILTNQTDGTTTLSTSGFGYEMSGAGYTLAIVNAQNVANANGALFKVARNSSDASVARFMYNNTSLAMMIRADGFIGFNGVTTLSTSHKIGLEVAGTEGLMRLINSTSSTEGGLRFEQSGKVNYWTVGSYGASEVFEIQYSGAERGIRLDPGGAVGIGDFGNTTYRCSVGSAGYGNTALFRIINSTSVKAYDVTTSGGIISQSWFGVTPVARQTGGALTAGAAYGANEQTMLNAIWTALQNYGLLT